jgi:hypothetical protein
MGILNDNKGKEYTATKGSYAKSLIFVVKVPAQCFTPVIDHGGYKLGKKQ